MTSWPAFDDKQIAVVERVLRSGRINYRTGEEGRAFDREHAGACGRWRSRISRGSVAAPATIS
jgi:dTDP-4-amino-4,6-dideoxygalactose transaminase